MSTLDTKAIIRELKIDAKAVGIPVGAAKVFIEKTVKDAVKSLSNKSIITDNDLNRAISKELKKYNADLAYVYKNRDTII
ncbi:hypothetical protein IKG10_03170 [Candidatus Saccharibacteria bacterium]|nr:hypothetical protein [Candidatus Saccharibacteria bacterium]